MTRLDLFLEVAQELDGILPQHIVSHIKAHAEHIRCLRTTSSKIHIKPNWGEDSKSESLRSRVAALALSEGVLPFGWKCVDRQDRTTLDGGWETIYVFKQDFRDEKVQRVYKILHEQMWTPAGE